MKTIDDRERRKRRREGIIIVLVIMLVVVLTLIESHLMRHETTLPATNSRILIFGLINVNIVLIILLLFLIIRNVVKLVFERRRGILGSKIRAKLVTAFVGLSLIPTAVLFIVAVNFLSYSVEHWFSLKIGDALSRTMELAQLSYQQAEDYAKFYARQIAREVTDNRLFEQERSPYLRVLLKQRQKAHNLGLVEVFLEGNGGRISVSGTDNPAIPQLT